jgi:transposase-like protein
VKGEAKSLEDLNKIIVEIKKGLIGLMYDEEMKEDLGFRRSENKEGGRENYKNGSYRNREKSREGELEVPIDRQGEYEAKVEPKGKRDIFEIEDKINSL